MSLLDEMRAVVRVTTDMTDIEIQSLIDAALADMERVGINPDLLTEINMDPLVKLAVSTFVKANYGFDNDDAERLNTSYHTIVSSLLNSSANTAGGTNAMEQ